MKLKLAASNTCYISRNCITYVRWQCLCCSHNQ